MNQTAQMEIYNLRRQVQALRQERDNATREAQRLQQIVNRLNKAYGDATDLHLELSRIRWEEKNAD